MAYAEYCTDLPAQVARAVERIGPNCGIASGYACNRSLGSAGLLFFKPEVAGIGPDGVREATKYLWHTADAHGISIRSAHAVSGRLALRRRFVQRNYALIHHHAARMPGDEVATFGLNSLSSMDWGPEIGASRLLGAWKASDLVSIWRDRSAEVRKLGEDCYGLPVELAGRRFVLLNGFYPYQIDSYREPTAKLVVFTFDTQESLERLKRTFQGDADPKVAQEGSVRAFLRKLNIAHNGPDIWTSQNGLHMSGSVADGLREILAFKSCFEDALR